MKNVVFNFIEKYGFIVLIGVIGAVMNRMRKTMSWKSFIASTILSVFVALCVGVIAEYFFHFPAPLIYVICGIFGTFSTSVLNEVQELIESITDILKNKLL